MKRLYHDDAYDTSPDSGNYWNSTAAPEPVGCPELQRDVKADVAIIGAGFTGLSAALTLAGSHGMDVRVLDAAYPGWGASGRNGGFVCVGGTKLSYEKLVSRFGANAATDFVTAQTAAIDHVDQILSTYGIRAQRHSHGEYQLAHNPSVLPDLEAEAAFLQETFGIEARTLSGNELGEIGMNGPHFHGGMHLPLGFALNPRQYLNGLLTAAISEGAIVSSRSPVKAIEQVNGRHRLITPGGTVEADHLIVATNGYTADDWVEWLSGRYLPVISNVLVTRPLTNAELTAQGWTSDQMAYDSRWLLHYFRLMPDRRFLFGMRGGTSLAPAAAARSKRRIRQEFERLFPAWRDVETPYSWSGLACLNRDLSMYVGPIADMKNAWTGYAFHGNGVSMGTYAGHLLADLVAGQSTADKIPEVMAKPPRRFPFPSWRLNYLKGAYLWYGLQDRG